MEDTRERILKSALETFSKHGYTGATTREIARIADVTEVTLFRHFSTKGKLFEEVICRFMAGPDFREIVHDAEKLEYKEALEAIGYAFLNGLRQNEDLIKVLYLEYQNHIEIMNNVYAAFINNLILFLGAYFKELQDKGLLRAFDPVIGAKIFIGSLTRFYEEEIIFKMNFSSEYTDDEALPLCVEIFLRGTQL